MKSFEFECLECGKGLSSLAAEKAANVGCPKCGGSDIDLAVDGKQKVMFSGLDCLPGQLDLFEVDGGAK